MEQKDVLPKEQKEDGVNSQELQGEFENHQSDVVPLGADVVKGTSESEVKEKKQGFCSMVLHLFIRLWHRLFSFFYPKDNTASVECITMDMVKEFFKNPQILQQLKENEDYLAVAIKQEGKNNKFAIILCIYDSKKEVVVPQARKALVSDKMDKILEDAFGNKSMLILQ